MSFRVVGVERSSGRPTEFVSRARTEDLARRSANALGIDVDRIEALSEEKQERAAAPVVESGLRRVNAVRSAVRSVGQRKRRPFMLGIMIAALVGSAYAAIQMPGLTREYMEASDREEAIRTYIKEWRADQHILLNNQRNTLESEASVVRRMLMINAAVLVACALVGAMALKSLRTKE